MKKLHTLALVLCLFASLAAQAQPSKKALLQRPEQHNAKFSVFDYTTKQPVPYAVVSSQSGFELGQTNQKGVLSVSVPANSTEFYSIHAEGYNTLTLRLMDADKKSGKYDIFLPSMELGYDRAVASADHENIPELENELVKVYVRQDPATYQKKVVQGGEILFSVQVAASSKPISETTAKKDWPEMEQVYVQEENGMYKVRIGPFETQSEAKQVLIDVKSKGRKDAFIVVQQNGSLNVPVVKANVKNADGKMESTQPAVTVQPESADYKVRVASYLHPGAFNPEGIDKLGTLESYRRGEWTIMMIGGFRTLEDAKRAKDIVLSKGFNDAAVVVNKEGIIETILE